MMMRTETERKYQRVYQRRLRATGKLRKPHREYMVGWRVGQRQLLIAKLLADNTASA
jgi:hypothetical protein